jgi:starvation-inducible DNA-binding protein
VETVAARTPFASFPSGSVDSTKVAPLVVERLGKIVENNQTRIENLGQADLVSQELVIGITGGPQKHEWMFAAEQPSRPS